MELKTTLSQVAMVRVLMFKADKIIGAKVKERESPYQSPRIMEKNSRSQSSASIVKKLVTQRGSAQRNKRKVKIKKNKR